MEEIPVGSSDEMTVTVIPEMSASHLGPAAVYSSPAMIGHFEELCTRLLAAYLEPGESSVGYHVDVRHLAPTSIGQKVTVKARILEVDGRKCLFGVEAYNEAEVKIGEGIHRRKVIDLSRFADKKG